MRAKYQKGLRKGVRKATKLAEDTHSHHGNRKDFCLNLALSLDGGDSVPLTKAEKRLRKIPSPLLTLPVELRQRVLVLSISEATFQWHDAEVHISARARELSKTCSRIRDDMAWVKAKWLEMSKDILDKAALQRGEFDRYIQDLMGPLHAAKALPHRRGRQHSNYSTSYGAMSRHMSKKVQSAKTPVPRINLGEKTIDGMKYFVGEKASPERNAISSVPGKATEKAKQKQLPVMHGSKASQHVKFDEKGHVRC